MPVADVTIREGDTLKPLLLTLESNARNTFARVGHVSDGTPFDLTGVDPANIALHFRIYDRSAAAFAGAGGFTITSAAAGQISYAWNVADVATAGRYRLEVEIDDSGRLTFPSAADVVLDIVADLLDS